MSGFEEVLEAWDGLGVVVHRDEPTGSWIFIALHDASLGPPLGGCRLRAYANPAMGLRDALRLAEGMTRKWAVVGFPYGGGKAVLAVPGPLGPEERTGLLRRFGRLVESLHGSYWTGEDLGTTPDDMRVVAQETAYAFGIDRETGVAADPGPFTALGVLAGMRAALARVLGDPSPASRTVLVQGVGDVGGPLAHLLYEAGARVLVCDTDPERARRIADRLGGTVVHPEAAYETACDVFAPCAVGGVLDARTADCLSARIVAGSANNQLADDSVAARLHARGIFYAPDYVINAGGAIALPMLHHGASEAEVRRRVEGIGDVLREIFAEAAAAGESPLAAAERRVGRALAEARSRS